MTEPTPMPVDPTKNDANWYCTFYYNPADDRVFVPKRWFGMTLNFAQPASYFVLALPFILGSLGLLAVLLLK